MTENNRIILEPSFILHRWPYKNSSYILDVFTKNDGRLRIIAQSARGPSSRFRGQLEPFSLLQISCSGRGELKYLNTAELSSEALFLTQQHLVYGFYLNELLRNLLPESLAYPQVFANYQYTLQQLHENKNIEITLRSFEKNLLIALGYALPLTHDIHNAAIQAEVYYQFVPENGFIPCAPSAEYAKLFLGEHLIALQENRWEEAVLSTAKNLMRRALAYYLDNKKINSRELLF